MKKTLKGLVLYLKKDKPLKRLRWEVAATISLFGKVSLVAGSFVQGFPRTVHGVSTWCPPNKESSWTECHILTGHRSKLEKAASSWWWCLSCAFPLPPVNKYFPFPFIFSLPYSYMFYLQPQSLQVTTSHFWLDYPAISTWMFYQHLKCKRSKIKFIFYPHPQTCWVHILAIAQV